MPPTFLYLAFTGGLALPDGREAVWLIGAALSSGLAYYAITAAMRIGEASLVTCFRYTRLVFALILAAVVLGDYPDALTLVGASIVIGSGLFVLLRERALSRRARAA